MPLGQTIYEPRAVVNHTYFPTSSIVAPLYAIENGASVRLSLIGNEGLTGISSLLGGGGTPSGIVVQTAGSGYRIKANALKKNKILGGRFTACDIALYPGIEFPDLRRTQYAIVIIISNSSYAVFF